jgi:Transglycosylase SLT domain/D-alanyl-D-alanine carboxypeptidase/Putative Flp pilus-assembly TadE/G-like
MRPLVLVSGSPLGGPSLPLAAALAVEAAQAGPGPVLLAELTPEPRRRAATLLAAPAARALEASLRDAGLSAAARGHLCHLAVPASAEGLAELAGAATAAAACVAQVPGGLWTVALDYGELEIRGGLVLVELPRERSLAALAAGELRERGLRARVASRPLPALAARRAVAGIRPGGSAGARLRRLARGLLPARGEGESGQALPAVLGAAAVIAICALLLTAIGGAVTGKGRVQRAADLAALSAAREMRDAVPRLLAPPYLPDGSPNPRHLSRAGYLARARLAARDAARRNRVDSRRLRVSFPDAAEWLPLRARVRVLAELDPRRIPGGERLGSRAGPPVPVSAVAVAEASPPADWSGMPTMASGGGYSGPLVYRNGEGMRPDVAAAFDRMAAAARRAGHALVVSDGFRSDAEQAEYFARNPDPRWVAPPGQSLHRCATELDLGPTSAYGWLAAHARRFGFLQRYSWEDWHYGYIAGPPPCSEAGNLVGTSGDGGLGGASLPAFVPGRYRRPILRSAARWNVSGALLAAQLLAESGFDPHAVSPAGAQGIAQFIPSTAAAYGLRDPFDPVAAIDAQAHLMSDLLRQFKSIPLALAAYNAGPGAVAACGCVPPYPETRAYVARILALLDGAGALLAPPLQVRLVE